MTQLVTVVTQNVPVKYHPLATWADTEKVYYAQIQLRHYSNNNNEWAMPEAVIGTEDGISILNNDWFLLDSKWANENYEQHNWVSNCKKYKSDCGEEAEPQEANNEMNEVDEVAKKQITNLLDGFDFEVLKTKSEKLGDFYDTYAYIKVGEQYFKIVRNGYFQLHQSDGSNFEMKSAKPQKPITSFICGGMNYLELNQKIKGLASK